MTQSPSLNPINKFPTNSTFAAVIALAVGVLFRKLFALDLVVADLLALLLAAWLSYRFDEYADNNWTGIGLSRFLLHFFYSAGFLHALVFQVLLVLSIFLSTQAKIALAFAAPLYGLYFMLVLYVPAFRGHVKSLFASFLFTSGCLIGSPLFALIRFQHWTFVFLAFCIWALIFHNMWICKTNNKWLQLSSAATWITIVLCVGCLLILYVSQLPDLPLNEAIITQLILLFPVQWAAGYFFPLNKRFTVDLVLLVGLLFALALAS